MRRTRSCGARPERRGLALLELVIVLPLLLAVLFGIIEFGSIFYTRHTMIQAAREAARAVAVQDGSTSDGIAAAEGMLSAMPNVNFDITITEPSINDPNARDVVVEITAPLAEAAIIDPLGFLGSGDVRARVTMRKEGL